VVVATNYAMMETGQPPHAFDYANIAEGKILVRSAVAGERLVSIDGTQCELTPNMLIIADGQGPVAIAGVMGGLDSEVSNGTTTILLEDAYFDPVNVRTTSRRLGLPSESSFRFERIVDMEAIDWASKRTAQLITQVAGGKVAKGVVDIYPEKKARKEVTLRLSRLGKLLGIEVPYDETVKILSRLGFQPRRNDEQISCTVPSWRSDIYREIDLIEEIIRIYGYAKVPTEQRIKIEVVPADTRQKLTESIGNYLNGCGFYETITVGFVDDAAAKLFTTSDAPGHLAVQDVSRKSANLLRQTLLGSLFGVLKTNVYAKNKPCRTFEIADTFVATGKRNSLPIEKAKLALVCDSNLRDLRGVTEGLINSIARDVEITFEPADLTWAEVGAEILVNGNVIGEVGVASQDVRKNFDFKEVSPCGAEMEFEQLMALQQGSVKVKPIPRYPAIERDLSIIVDENTAWSDIVEAVSRKASSELEDIQFVDIYRGKGIPASKKSVTISLRFRDEEGTLTHETVDGLEADIVQSLNESIGAELRTF
jgi:phenylalanyl-tRNA synthetase beta chain